MKIGFIGCGRMAQALIQGMIRSGIFPGDIVATDRHLDWVLGFSEETGICLRNGIGDVVEEADLVLLCVKPPDVDSVIPSLRELEKTSLLVSIVAGLTLERLEQALPAGWIGVRAMPNIAAEVGASATCLAFPVGLSLEKQQIVHALFTQVGSVLEISEKNMDVATAVGGSGPGFLYMVIESMIEGGVKNGLDRKTATQLVAQAAVGCGRMVVEGVGHPSLLRESVTSPGGTTAAGLAMLEQYGLRAAMIDAIDATVARSKEL